jgi:AraC-like DNA-binding protein
MFKTVFDIFTSPLSGSLKKLLIEAKVLELIALQLNTSLLGVDAKKTKRRSKDHIYDVKEYLDKSYLEVHSLKSISKTFGINEFALKNGFKEIFQTTVFEFILSRRLEYARDLLLHTDCTIQEVGSKVGYKYPNHFSTAFKNKFGISPGKVTLIG